MRFKRTLACIAAFFSYIVMADALVKASTVSLNGTILNATGTAGDDVITLDVDLSGLLVLSGVAFTSSTPSCSISAADARCSLSGLTEVRLFTLAGDDVVSATGLPARPSILFVTVLGDGDDIYIGSPLNDTWGFGGAGDDVLFGGGSLLNCMNGGSGNNVIIGSSFGGCIEPSLPPETSATPLPASLLLFASGLVVLGIGARHRPPGTSIGGERSRR